MKRFKWVHLPCYLCRFFGVVWERFGATRGPQNEAPRKGRRNPGSGRRTGKSRNACGREDGGRAEADESGENRRELDERKGEEGERKLEEAEGEAEENVTKLERTGRKEGGGRRKHNRGRGTIPKRYARKGEETNPEAAWRTKWRDRREPDARKGKNGKEAEEEHE